MTECHIPLVLYISTYFLYIGVCSKRKIGRNSGTRLLIPARSFCCGQLLRQCVAGALGEFGKGMRNVREVSSTRLCETLPAKVELGKSHS